MKLPRYFIFMLFIFQSINGFAQNGLSSYYNPFPGSTFTKYIRSVIYDNNDNYIPKKLQTSLQ